MPHIIPNPLDNTLLVQGTPQEWEQISRLLAQLDVPPRQILVEAKIYEVQLQGALQYGVEAYLQQKSAAVPSGFTAPGTPGGFLANTAGQVLTLTGGLLVGHSRELLAALNATENVGKTKTIAAPSLIATDSIPATMNVGQSIPTLSSEGVAQGVTSGGSSLFTNTISNANTGVTLTILARANSSGIITMLVNQQVSSPTPTTTSSIQSPSFSTRSFQTQMTVQDGDTVAIGGIIQDQFIDSSSGIPFLQRIPIIGAAFGKIVTALVNDVLMPPLGRVLKNVDFTNLFVDLSGGNHTTLAQAKAAGAATINYGLFLNTVIDFLIVAFVIFIGTVDVKIFQPNNLVEPPLAPGMQIHPLFRQAVEIQRL